MRLPNRTYSDLVWYSLNSFLLVFSSVIVFYYLTVPFRGESGCFFFWGGGECSWFEKEINAGILTAISRKVVHCCRKKCARDNSERWYGIWSIHCSCSCSCRTYFCCFPLAIANISPWLLVPLLKISLENSELKTNHNSVFHSRGQHLCKFIGTTESVYIKKEFNSHRTGLGHKHGRRFIVWGHKYGHHDVMWKHTIPLGIVACPFSDNLSSK